MPGKSPNAEEVFDIERIRQLVDLMEQHDVTEVDLRCQNQRIRLRRGNEPDAVAAPSVAASTPPSAPPTAVVAPGQRAEDGENIVLIKSPMVGTFYSRPNPEAEQFVKIGDRITPDKTVCIIEAMKVFNEIPAEVSGTIVAQLADEEEAVEFGRPLFKVDTSK